MNLFHKIKLAPSFYIERNVNEESFLSSCEKYNIPFSLYTSWNDNRSYQIDKPINILGIDFYITIYFLNHKIHNISVIRKTNETWGTYDPLSELDFYQKFLEKHYAKNRINDSYIFDWGTIVSIFDRKGYLAYIGVEYKNN